MPKNNCYISVLDNLHIYVMDAQKTIEYFGERGLEENGHYAPPELIQEWQDLNARLFELEAKLERRRAEEGLYAPPELLEEWKSLNARLLKIEAKLDLLKQEQEKERREAL